MRLEIRQQRSGISSQNNFRNHHFQIERNQPISERQKDREIIAASPKQGKNRNSHSKQKYCWRFYKSSQHVKA